MPRPARGGRPRHVGGTSIRHVPMPEPVLPVRPEPHQHDGPPLAGMEEVGTGLLDHVDAMQRVAASAPPGPLLINAGPGTGKTHILTRRIAYLVAELHVPASQCLVLARTTEAADALRRELDGLLGPVADDMTVRAFDAAGELPPLGHLFVDDLEHMPIRLYETLRADRGDQPAFTATGDPDAHIADGEPGPFERFAQDYPEARVVRLSRNHRSTAPILAAAMQLITPVSRAPGRGMLPARPAAGTAPVGRHFALDDRDERHFAGQLAERLRPFGVAPDEVAILAPEGYTGIDTARPITSAAGREHRVVCCVGVTAEAFPDEPGFRRLLFAAMSRARDLLYVSHIGNGSPLLDDIDPGLFTPFGHVRGHRSQPEQPRLL
ncbi:UvrD-helicase domain-containing protein [Stackebrandtia albiflava]|uniref:UvrD-helicase domain-containing protein n=1 Tax=Stackebrandtia albiflava TaxID=406432 RepID=UPI001B87B48C|nr:UvrD-helicase domain-containing protein [Stackebrandtia albiflava]